MRSTVLALVVALLGGPALGPTSAQAEPSLARSGAFHPTTVVDLARALSLVPFAPPDAALPGNLANLDYNQYRDIRFRPSATIWAADRRRFQVQLFHRGFLFADPVEIAVVGNGTARHLPYSPDLFTAGGLVTAPLPASDIGFSGFRALSPINRPGHFDEIAVFQGASYFRSLGRNQGYGLSARGLALRTADAEGEEFPAFRAFWIEEPQRRSPTLVVHALLDSPSVTGAYRFTIRPGPATIVDVEAMLFPRTDLVKVGLAPASSMFLFSANGRTDIDDFRPQVHDSDGLLIINGRGEHLWRPLANPSQLQVSAFLDDRPRGFGLMQRARDPKDFQDFEAHYERRPSLWIEPAGNWGAGAVVLAEIPSDSEIHDNIVAFWRPQTPLAAGSTFRFAYRLYWGEEPTGVPERARVVATRRGRADVEAPTSRRRFVVDYTPLPPAGRAPDTLPRATVSASAGEVRDVVVAVNPLTTGYRVSFVLDPGKETLSELRLDLGFEDGRRAETWVYRWTEP